MTAEPQNLPALRQRRPAEPDADLVRAYLLANPQFLAENPALYARLTPPVRVHGGVFADHMAAMLQQARARAAEMEARAADVLAAGRATTGIAERVQEAVLALIRAADPAECVAEDWPGLLGIDSAALCCETVRPRWRTLPLGAVRTLMRNRTLVFRDKPGDAALLHAEAALLAERDLLVGLPGVGLLALASRDALALPVTQAWGFLGRALAARV